MKKQSRIAVCSGKMERAKKALLGSIVAALLASSASAKVTIVASLFTGTDTNDIINATNATFTANTTGFSAAGKDKLVVTVNWHNSALRVPFLTGVTYNGVAMIQAVNKFFNNQTYGGYSGGAVWYLDNVAADGNLVLTFDNTHVDAQSVGSYYVDEIGLSMFALNGTAAGVASASGLQTSITTPTVTVGAGDFVIGGFGKNNAGNVALDATTIAAGYSGTAGNIKYGNLGGVVGYQVMGVSGVTYLGFASTTVNAVNYISAFTAAPPKGTLISFL